MQPLAPIVFVGPRGGYRGEDRTLVATLLERGRAMFEVDVVPEAADAPPSLDDILSRIDYAMGQATALTGTTPDSERSLPALVGYSMGAQAAATFTAANPGRVGSLTLVAGWATATDKMRGVRRVADAGGDLRAHVTHLVLGSAHGWPGELDEARLPRSSAEIGALLDLCDTAELASIAPQITDPVLVIGASRDEFATAQQSRLLFGAIPDSRFAEVDSGHLVCVERPAEVASLIEPFVNDPGQHPAGTRIGGYQP